MYSDALIFFYSFFFLARFQFKNHQKKKKGTHKSDGSDSVAETGNVSFATCSSIKTAKKQRKKSKKEQKRAKKATNLGQNQAQIEQKNKQNPAGRRFLTMTHSWKSLFLAVRRRKVRRKAQKRPPFAHFRPLPGPAKNQKNG
jgi:hypothetical protein